VLIPTVSRMKPSMALSKKASGSSVPTATTAPGTA
jgi:hypothetical protein